MEDRGGDWCFVPPSYQRGFHRVSDAAGFLSYLAAALGIVLLTGPARKRIEAERRLHEQLAAEGKLRDAQKLFQLFMENRPGFSYLRERSGRYVYFNSAVRRLLGLDSPGTQLPEFAQSCRNRTRKRSGLMVRANSRPNLGASGCDIDGYHPANRCRNSNLQSAYQ
jgi:PAS domain-containing protein